MMLRPSRRAISGAVLTLAGLAGLLTVSVVSAHIPLAGATQDPDGYSTIFGHNRTVRIQLMNSLRGYSYMITDYNNARGHLIDNLATYTYATPFWVDNLPGDPQSPDVWIVEAGSYDENVLNYVYGFSACSSSTAWGKTYGVTFYGTTGHWHTVQQKLCVWPSRIGNCPTCRLNVNGQGLRYQYLTLEHEMSHAAVLADGNGDGHAALMNQGASMLELNIGERDGVRNHY